MTSSNDETESSQPPEWNSDSDSSDSSDSNSNSSEFACTCQQSPPVVQLGNKNDVDSPARATLVENLQTLGWSPLRIPVVVGDEAASSYSPPPTQEQILKVFQQYRRQQDDSSVSSDLVYIAAESGSTQGTVEPKESLEVQLAVCDNRNGESSTPDDDPEQRIKTWCQSLSCIAHQVCDLLGIPPDTFLSSSETESLDLLRVFHYYALNDVGSNTQDTDDVILGSSPHTDWGSLTIVWQDHVGGLQTYCRACQKWIDVPPLENYNGMDISNDDLTEPQYWQVIVHVGDMASIALNALSVSSTNGQPQQQQQSSKVDSVWPSPKHRVVSSKAQERVSLVYFAYPPAQTSLATIHKTLQDSKLGKTQQSNARRRRLPLKEYYLLHDQSPITSGSTRKSPEDMFKQVWSLPIQDIVALKWKQVSRDDSSV